MELENTPTIEDAKNAYRDAAGLLLYLFRDDVESVKAITDANPDPGKLLSGMIAVAAMIVSKAFEDNTVEALESLVSYLSTVPDEEWEQVATNSRVI